MVYLYIDAYARGALGSEEVDREREHEHLVFLQRVPDEQTYLQKLYFAVTPASTADVLKMWIPRQSA